MISRVTENMKFNAMTNNLYTVQSQSADLMEKLTTQKNINRPSDDPVGTGQALNYRSTLASIEQYQKNITDANTWLSLTNTNLSGIKDVIAKAINVATTESLAGGDSATSDTRDSSVTFLSSLIDQVASLMNAKCGDSYLFSGSKTDVAPFSTNPLSSIGDATAAPVNTFDGTVTSGGTYTGTVNKNYAFKIIDGGTIAAATYKISADGGTTWGATLALPPQAVKGSIANTAGGSPITSATVWNTITGANVQNGTTVAITGKKHDGTVVGGLPADTFTIADAATGTVQDLLTQIQTTFGGTVTASIDTAGKITVTDNTTGESQMAMTLVTTNPVGGALNFGTVATTTTTSITLGDGMNITINDSGAQHLAAGDKYTVNATAATIGTATATAVPPNTYAGTVTSGGTYTGTTDKTYLVKIVAGGALGAATYHMSTDNGAHWGTTYTVGAGGTITLGDSSDVTNGATMTFTAGTFAAGDSFTVNAGAAITGNATAAPVNTFDGTVVASGAYTGMVDKTYALKIIAGGPLADATYKISSDGGVTWGSTKTGLSTQTTLGDGIKLTFTAGTNNLAADDLFTVKAIATGIGTASAATANAFNGTVASGGTYTGTENKTYAVKIITGGTLAVSTYKISADGGKTWGAVQALPPQEVKGSIANTAGGLPITAATAWNKITGANVQNGTTIAISGKKHDGTAVGPGTYTIANAATGTVHDLLTQIETTFGGTVTASIDAAGKITVTDNTTGESQMAMTLVTTNPVGGSLDFGAVTATTTKTITLGDGITTTFTPNTVNLAANDLFTVNAYPAGSYRGDGDNLTMQIGKNNNFIYNITGSSAFAAANGPVANASLTTGTGTTLTKDDNIMLTRGGTAGSWTLTNHTQYPNMVIASVSDTAVNIDVDGTGTDVIKLSLSGTETWSANNTASFSITGSTVGPPATQASLSSVTVHGPGTVDLLTTLTAIKTALEANDGNEIAARIEELQVAQTQVVTHLATVGTKINSLTLTKENHTAFNEQITNLSSKIETADLAKLIVAYQMKQTALQASYSMAAQVGKMTILDYLK